MKNSIGLITLVVDDYDRAIEFYVEKIGFRVFEDTPLISEKKRWVVVGPPDAVGTKLLLAKAKTEKESNRVGDQTGGRVFLFLYTDDFEASFQKFSSAGVHFVSQPRQETYGTVAVFEDLYGNRWDLIEPA